MNNVYHIRVKGHLDPSWSNWFNNLQVMCREDGVTDLIGPVADQAALHGLLIKLRDLRLPLLSLHQVESISPDNENGSDSLE
ncbi:MAG: hypothetical protein KDI79_05025 [Anaerolineae bacterium]|nr:hypothetical protein [Anaerolineae bacterium]